MECGRLSMPKEEKKTTIPQFVIFQFDVEDCFARLIEVFEFIYVKKGASEKK
jgi:hypothetical protein